MFDSCTSLKSVNLPLMTRASMGLFAFCSSLTHITLPLLTTIESGTSMYHSMFRACGNLEYVDMPSLTAIGGHGLYWCSSLRTLILRNTEAVCSLAATTGINADAVASGEFYIYVPAALYDSYVSGTNWTEFADLFRKLEDYTVDGTTTGELDETKI